MVGRRCRTGAGGGREGRECRAGDGLDREHWECRTSQSGHGISTS